jgi:sialidase-1
MTEGKRMVSDLTIEDVFVATGENFYRIPSLALTRNGDLLTFANRRRHTAADSAEEVHLVSRRWRRESGQWEKTEDLFAKPRWKATIGTAILDGNNNSVMVLYYRRPSGQDPSPDDPMPGAFVVTSVDNGRTWQHETLKTYPNEMKSAGSTHGAGPGITLRFGPRKGRLIAPARFALVPNEEIETLQRYHYNCAVYSDDAGRTWRTSEPVQVGTGEGCLAELLDGRIYYNSRAYFLDGMRRVAWSYDGGETFEDFSTERALSEPLEGGCNASLIRVPGTAPEERDLLLFCNPTDTTRKRLTVRASRDGGLTWKGGTKLICEGPSAYSSMTASKDGIIYILFENGDSSPYERISLARFSLSCLLSVETLAATAIGIPLGPAGSAAPR